MSCPCHPLLPPSPSSDWSELEILSSPEPYLVRTADCLTGNWGTGNVLVWAHYCFQTRCSVRCAWLAGMSAGRSSSCLMCKPVSWYQLSRTEVSVCPEHSDSLTVPCHETERSLALLAAGWSSFTLKATVAGTITPFTRTQLCWLMTGLCWTSGWQGCSVWHHWIGCSLTETVMDAAGYPD